MSRARRVPTRPDRRGRRLALSLAVALGLTAALLAGAHLLDQHRSYGEWSWAAPSPTPLLPFHGRSYVRGATEPAASAGLLQVGVTWDGLRILGPPGAGTPTELDVQTGPHAFVPYALQGGP